jgi:hypothetical protein
MELKETRGLQGQHAVTLRDILDAEAEALAATVLDETIDATIEETGGGGKASSKAEREVSRPQFEEWLTSGSSNGTASLRKLFEAFQRP